MKKINAAVIGCGNISKFHFSGLEKCGAGVKWVCDLNQAAAAPWAAKDRHKNKITFSTARLPLLLA